MVNPNCECGQKDKAGNVIATCSYCLLTQTMTPEQIKEARKQEPKKTDASKRWQKRMGRYRGKKEPAETGKPKRKTTEKGEEEMPRKRIIRKTAPKSRSETVNKERPMYVAKSAVRRAYSLLQELNERADKTKLGETRELLNKALKSINKK